MTVSTSTRKQTYAGGQGTLAFTFQALADHPDDIKVVQTLIATGAETELTYNSDYTVSINSDGIGGTVTVSPTYSTAYTQTVYRKTSLIQDSDYDDYNQFPADTLEENLDRLTMIAQEQAEAMDRTLKYSIASTGSTMTLPIPEADTYIGWNAGGTALENKSIPDPSTLVKASGAEAAAGTEDTHYMTPAKTKTAIETFAPSTNTLTILQAAYPVGSIYINASNSTTPATLFGFGTWVAFGSGRVLVGIDAGIPSFATIALTGGTITHTLLITEIPAHTHKIGNASTISAGSGYNSVDSGGSLDSGTTGGGGAHTNLQPYIVVYMWKRTA